MTETITFFPPNFRTPDKIIGPIEIEEETRFGGSLATICFLYRWDVVGPRELTLFEVFMEEHAGRMIQGWIHPGEGVPGTVILSDLKVDEDRIRTRSGEPTPLYGVTIAAFIIQGAADDVADRQ